METFVGLINTVNDALIIFEACRMGRLPLVKHRLTESERIKYVYSGAVFVWEEGDSGIRRWTDGCHWSPSRINGSFLIYRQVQDRKTKLNGLSSETLKNEKGLNKKAISVVTNDKRKYHLVSYYTMSDLNSNELKTPSSLADFSDVIPLSEVYPEFASESQPETITKSNEALSYERQSFYPPSTQRDNSDNQNSNTEYPILETDHPLHISNLARKDSVASTNSMSSRSSSAPYHGSPNIHYSSPRLTATPPLSLNSSPSNRPHYSPVLNSRSFIRRHSCFSTSPTTATNPYPIDYASHRRFSQPYHPYVNNRIHPRSNSYQEESYPKKSYDPSYDISPPYSPKMEHSHATVDSNNRLVLPPPELLPANESYYFQRRRSSGWTDDESNSMVSEKSPRFVAHNYWSPEHCKFSKFGIKEDLSWDIKN